MSSTLDLYINLSVPARRSLVQGYATLSQASPPEFVLRDTVQVRLHFMTVASSSRTGTTKDLGNTLTVRLGAKAASGYSASNTFLFYSQAFTRNNANAADVFYVADIDLNTTEFAAAFTSGASQVSILGEVELTDGATRQTVSQFGALGLFDVIRGDEEPPSDATPHYPQAPTANGILGGNAAGTAWTQYPSASFGRSLLALTDQSTLAGTMNGYLASVEMEEHPSALAPANAFPFWNHAGGPFISWHPAADYRTEIGLGSSSNVTFGAVAAYDLVGSYVTANIGVTLQSTSLSAGTASAVSLTLPSTSGTLAKTATTLAGYGITDAVSVDVASYGASPSASAATNASAINSALSAGGIVFISKAGTYEIGDTLVIKARTTLILSPGVVLKRVGMTNVSLIKNAGANSANNTMDEDITILGNGARIEVNGNEGSTADVYGMRSHLNFYNVRRLRVSGLRCTDLERVNFFIQLANHEDCEVSHLYITGTGAGNIKDGIHLNGGDRLWVHDCYIATNDDPIAFNCWDYATLTPRVQPLRNVVVERMRYGVPSGGTADGYCPRFLPSAWAAWSNGGSYILADTVNNGGYQYRKTNSGTVAASVAPTHTTTGQTVTGADGIAWTCTGACTFTKAPIENVTFRDITVSANVYALFTENNDSNGRSIYTGQSSAGLCKNITFSRIRFDLPTAETSPLALIGISCENVVAEDIVLESGKLPSAIFQLVGASGRLVLRRIYAPTWRNSASVGFVQISTGGSFSELLVEDCNVTGLNDGANFQSSDGILCYTTIANSLGRVIVRGGRYDWLPSLIRPNANGGVNLDIQGASFAKFRRLFVTTSGTGSSTISVRGNRFEQAATLGLWGSTVSGQTITGNIVGNTFDAASVIVFDTGGASRITFSDAPAVTASLAGAAAGDLVRTASGWQEYNGSAWGAVRN